jgi:ferric-dicitrate binding protein FerR (iron transport regulator)
MEYKLDKYDIIIKYLTGNLSDPEIKQLSIWINENSLHLNEFREIRDFWIHSNVINSENETEDALQSFHDKIKFAETGKSRRLPMNWLYKAAVIILLFTSAFFVYMYLTNTQPAVFDVYAENYNTVEIPVGEKGQITLSDGTKVWLNSDSKLKYPAKFEDTRVVELIGEAYFNVVKNQDVPFYVKTSTITVRVTGTEFNIKSYPGEGIIKTTLVEGSVEILKNSESNQIPQVKLLPNETATYNKLSNTFHVDRVSTNQMTENKKIKVQKIQTIEPTVETITSWRQNELVFNNETLEEMVTKMERWYGVEITLKTEPTDERYSGKFVYNESIDQVLHVLSKTTPIEYNIEKNRVFIRLK